MSALRRRYSQGARYIEPEPGCHDCGRPGRWKPCACNGLPICPRCHTKRRLDAEAAERMARENAEIKQRELEKSAESLARMGFVFPTGIVRRT